MFAHLAIPTHFYWPYQFRGITNTMKLLNKTSLLTESYTFFNSIYSWYSVSLFSHFISIIWRMLNQWLIFDLLLRYPHSWSPIVSSAYGVNLEGRMLDKILYVVNKVVCLYNYYNLFYYPSYKWIQWSTLPLIMQFILIPKRLNTCRDITANCSNPCLNQFCWQVINIRLFVSFSFSVAIWHSKELLALLCVFMSV